MEIAGIQQLLFFHLLLLLFINIIIICKSVLTPLTDFKLPIDNVVWV